MATIQIDEQVNLSELIIQASKEYGGGGSRSIKEIKRFLELLNDHTYDCSLRYTKDEFRSALEHLVHDGFHLDNMHYYLRVKIYMRIFTKPTIEFWLYGVPDGNKVKNFEHPLGIQSPKEWPDPVGVNPGV